MGYKAMERLKDLLCRELDEIAGKGELSAGDLETVHTLTDTVKNIDKISMLEDGEGYSGRYSGDGGWMAEGRYSRTGDRYGDSYGRHYVRAHYSRAKGMVTDRIREMMEDPDIEPNERKALQRALDTL